MKVIETHEQIGREEKIRTEFNQLRNLSQQIALFEHLYFLVNYFWGALFLGDRSSTQKSVVKKLY